MLASVTHINPFTIITRRRTLNHPGKVLVRKGQKVSAADAIAETTSHPKHILLNVAKGLGIPPEKTAGVIQCYEGDDIAEGDIIAGPVGFTRRLMRSPGDGKVILIGEGQVLIELKGKPFQLKAGMPGVVEELIEGQGAVVQTTGSLIQGVWGNGRIDFGLLVPVMEGAGESLAASKLDVSLRGSIVAAGICEHAEVFRVAKELPLRGLILASMDVSLIEEAINAPYPVILLEGFGKMAMNSIAYKLLSTSEGREVAVNAEGWDRYKGTRPEIVIPLPDTGKVAPAQDADFFNVGQEVRVIGTPFASKIGKITNLVEEAVFPSGFSAPGAEVHLEGGKEVLLPLQDLDLIK